jgi:hypothetical protein
LSAIAADVGPLVWFIKNETGSFPICLQARFAHEPLVSGSIELSGGSPARVLRLAGFSSGARVPAPPAVSEDGLLISTEN